MRIKFVREKTVRRQRLVKRVGAALLIAAAVHSFPDLLRELKLYRM